MRLVTNLITVFVVVSCFATAIACGASKAKRKLNATGGTSGTGAKAGAAGTGNSGGVAGNAGASGGVAGHAGAGNTAGVDAGTDAGTGDAGPPKCPVGMVFGPNEAFCIDSTEVPRKAYDLWLKTNPATASQGPECQFNTDFAPTSAGQCANLQFLDPFIPQTCVDWCDAQAFCMANGRRLCGQIGAPQGVAPFNAKDATFSQWYSACTLAGTRPHPYGSFVAGKCNDQAAGKGELVKVPFAGGTCVGGVGQLYDMSGNAREWIDSCTANKGASDQCLVFGGSFKASKEADLSCSGSGSASRNTATLADIGFRCCWDLP